MSLGIDSGQDETRPWRLEVLEEALEQCRCGGEALSIGEDLRRSYLYQLKLGRIECGPIPRVYREGFAMCEARRAELSAQARQASGGASAATSVTL